MHDRQLDSATHHSVQDPCTIVPQLQFTALRHVSLLHVSYDGASRTSYDVSLAVPIFCGTSFRDPQDFGVSDCCLRNHK
jgi:hypothetical protein